MIRFIMSAYLALAPALLSSQTAQPDKAQPDVVTKVVRVRGDANILAHLVGGTPGISLQASDQLHAIVITGRSPTLIAAVEKTIQELDSEPPPSHAPTNVEITIYLLNASTAPIPGTPDVTAEGLAPVLKQLRAVFPYTHYQMLGTILLRSGKDSPAATSGLMKTPTQTGDLDAPTTYSAGYDAARVSGDPPIIHLQHFRLQAKVSVLTGIRKSKDNPAAPSNTSYYQGYLLENSADLDLREGQKTVVGNSNIGDENASIFLVVSARVVQ